VAAAAGVACAAAGLAFILFAPLPGESGDVVARTQGRGIIDYRLEQATVDLGGVPAMVAEMGPDALRASWTRILVHWNALQPAAPDPAAESPYAEAYVAQLDAIVDACHGAGITPILTMVDVPEWASDRDVWKTPRPSFPKGVYQPFYAPDMDDLEVRGAFKAVGAFLAARYEGKVSHFECWNEPNQGSYLYPQAPASATNGGGATYLEMLTEWHAGVKSGNPDAAVIAGATAPRGRGDAESTPPQAFARYLADHGVLDLMDAYSHHPYTPGGSTRIAPGEPPNNPNRAVTLGNLDQITRLFPAGTPFYLTEFGYNTEYSVWFGVTVSRAEQARFLREGYAFTQANYPQVKALLWFLVDDWNPSGEPGDDKGVYMGVRTFDGERKPSWYAFAGGNAVTLTAPETAGAGAEFAVSGALTVARDPSVVGGQTLTVQWREPSGGSWSKAATVTTSADGTYSLALEQRATRVYRVVWGGVCESTPRTVRTP
jgi:hypothetical protein